MSKANPIEPAEIPPHMLENPTSRAQKKAFAKVKRAAKAEEKEAEKASTKKSAKKSE
jgi:hypothetical protein